MSPSDPIAGLPENEDYGHFTAMQVRRGATRGLQLHLDRVDAANRQIFGEPLDGDVVRQRVRRGLGDRADASVRFSVLRPAGEPWKAPTVMVAVDDPVAMPTGPLRLRSAVYQRPLPHLKHVASAGQRHHRELALHAGFDEALLTNEGGVISEGAITNVGFLDGTTVVWPDAPALAGITMQLVVPALAARGIRSVRRQVRLADIVLFDGAFVTNSWGVATVSAIDDVPIPVDDAFAVTLMAAYQSVPWDPI
ncbi:MAG TPA: aminotransferase class IV [Jiangellaceae bacterium]|nr:aminotransferase class IV [Jiangellaceae bacterium]